MLLTFCCYTTSFEITLIAFQIDVFCNSRSNREHLSYSIYTDVIYLTEEPKLAFGYRVEERLRSPAGLEKKVAGHKLGLCLDVSGLKISTGRCHDRGRILLVIRDICNYTVGCNGLEVSVHCALEETTVYRFGKTALCRHML